LICDLSGAAWPKAPCLKIINRGVAIEIKVELPQDIARELEAKPKEALLKLHCVDFCLSDFSGGIVRT
jgi:hypothetical protein